MNTETQIVIRPGRQADAESFRAGVKSVAGEKWFLATVDGFSLEETFSFLQRAIEHSLPQLVAVYQDQVVGWCDVMPGSAANGFGHVGRLGMGVLPAWRRRGLGRDLVKACIPIARSIGIEKVELEVFADNVAAVSLYESLGFVREGLKVHSRKLEGRYQDVLAMGLWIGP
jgi:ribosomal protein S18 acetylase RimI-like enzyme